MEYRVFSDKIFLRIDKGEEIMSSLKAVCEKEGVKLASVSAIGAVNNFTVGVFSPESKTYKSNTFAGDVEIDSLLGTVTLMDGQFYAHLHMSAGDGEGKVFGGHLNEAHVSATCEMVIDIAPGRVERTFSPDIGLNLWDFEK